MHEHEVVLCDDRIPSLGEQSAEKLQHFSYAGACGATHSRLYRSLVDTVVRVLVSLRATLVRDWPSTTHTLSATVNIKLLRALCKQ